MALVQTTGFWPVLAALAGNAFVTIIKFFAASISGSSSMLSEAIHSVADTANQLLLLLGLKQSLRKADDKFEYGYGNERFFWALISACGIFFVGAGVTAYNGIGALLYPPEIELDFMVIGVLCISFAVELYTLSIAYRQIVRAFPDLPWSERLREADSSTLAVLLEDAVAVLGVAIAALAIVLSYLTGNTVWDAAGSLVIALLLCAVAVTLIVKNRAYLLGHSMPDELREAIIEALESDPSIEKVIDFKSTPVGLRSYRIKFEVEFNGVVLLPEAYPESTLRDEFEEVSGDFESFKRFAADYSDRIPRLIGRKIDELEADLKKRFPTLKHIDIEIN